MNRPILQITLIASLLLSGGYARPLEAAQSKRNWPSNVECAFGLFGLAIMFSHLGTINQREGRVTMAELINVVGAREPGRVWESRVHLGATAAAFLGGIAAWRFLPRTMAILKVTGIPEGYSLYYKGKNVRVIDEVARMEAMGEGPRTLDKIDDELDNESPATKLFTLNFRSNGGGKSFMYVAEVELGTELTLSFQEISKKVSP